MRYLLGFATSFAAVLLVAAILRAAWLSRDAAPAGPPPASEPASHEHAASPADKEDEHENHRPDNRPAVERPVEVQMLGNAADPVSGAPLGEGPRLFDHKGWRIGFADDDTLRRFEKNPIRYYARLSLEPTAEGRLLKVDGSRYEKAFASECPIMGGEIDPDGEVFILHRGFKVYFCCWSGCADEFLASAQKHYAHYGLIERDGKLQRK